MIKMNKITIPAILASVLLVAGVFAFIPVEQVSTVHDLLASQTTVGNEFAGQDRAVFVSANFSHGLIYQVNVIPADSDVTLTGFAIVSSIPNNGTADSATATHNCFLQSTGGARIVNATFGSTNSTTIGSTNMPAGAGLTFGQTNASLQTGVCTATIILESWDD